MSAGLPPIADIARCGPAGQKSAKTGCEQSQQWMQLFDHLLGADKQGWWNFEAKRLGGLEIYGQLELDRLFYRKLARSRAAQNLGDVTGRAPILSGKLGP
jgi:hypothetical protein